MLQSGTAAPEITLTDLSGTSWSLHKALGKCPVLLAFFKISCPTCQLTFPFLQRLADGRAPSAPELVAISQDDATGTRQFHERFSITLPTLLDPAGKYPASNAYKISSVPSLFLVEQNGEISRSFEGFDKAEIEQLGQRFGFVPFGPGDQVPSIKPG